MGVKKYCSPLQSVSNVDFFLIYPWQGKTLVVSCCKISEFSCLSYVFDFFSLMFPECFYAFTFSITLGSFLLGASACCITICFDRMFSCHFRMITFYEYTVLFFSVEKTRFLAINSVLILILLVHELKFMLFLSPQIHMSITSTKNLSFFE